MKKIRISFFALLLLVVAVGCSDNKNKVPVVFDKSIDDFCDIVESVEFCSLETDTIHFIGKDPYMLLCGDDYIFSDRNPKYTGIYRYSSSGEFLNTIGRKGNGEGEYVSIHSLQVRGDEVVVFSNSNKLLFYSKDGTFLRDSVVSPIGLCSYLFSDNTIVNYYGYGGPFRLKAEGASLDKEFITEPNTERVIPYIPYSNALNYYDGALYIADCYNPTIFRYSDGEIEDHVTFDFGKREVPESYFKMDNPYEGSSYLMSIETSLINCLKVNGFMEVAEIFSNIPGEATDIHYGIHLGEKWLWFYAGKMFKDPLAATLQAIDGKFLYFLLTPHNIAKMPEKLIPKCVNFSQFANLPDESNYVVARIKIK